MNRIALAVIALTIIFCGSLLAQQDPPQIVQATYGAGDVQMDVTEKLQTAIANGQTNIRATNSFFGKDPIFGKVKTLSVIFVQGGVQYQTTAREGEQLSFAQSNVAQSNVPQQAPSTPADAPATQPTQQRRLAPEGVFFLTERMILGSNFRCAGG